MRKVFIGAVIAVTAGATGLMAPRPVSALTVQGPCAEPLVGNGFVLRGALTTPLPSAGSPANNLTKKYAEACPTVGVTGLIVSEGLATPAGTWANSGFAGDCLVSAGSYPVKTIGVEVVIGDAAVIGIGDSQDEVNVLIPASATDIPCTGTGPTSALNFNSIGLQYP